MRQANTNNRSAVALLIVLFIVMAITIVSLGHLARCDVELACGENMLLKAQMDCLAESGLEHARGLILNPQDIDGGGSGYWTGGERLQIYGGSNDYYDVAVQCAEPNAGPTYRCNYYITSEAYREKQGAEVGRSLLAAQLRINPCITLWSGANTTIPAASAINGDVYCDGRLTNIGTINGDVFAKRLIGDALGRLEPPANLLLSWPSIRISDFTSHYTTRSISTDRIPPGVSLPGAGEQVDFRDGDLRMDGGVHVASMLIVKGNLTIGFDPNVSEANIFVAQKNIPAIFVTKNLVVLDKGKLYVEGLVVVEGKVQIGANCDVDILGGLFVDKGVTFGATSSDVTITGAPTKTAILTWSPSGSQRRWGQAAGALFKVIKRQ